jgi:hypothetical protein
MASFKELDKMANGINLKKCNCTMCLKASWFNIFPKDRVIKILKLLEIVHTNVCGLMRICHVVGVQYFVTFINNFSKKTHVYPLKAKKYFCEKF